jgi:hypothetical protein
MEVMSRFGTASSSERDNRQIGHRDVFNKTQFPAKIAQNCPHFLCSARQYNTYIRTLVPTHRGRGRYSNRGTTKPTSTKEHGLTLASMSSTMDTREQQTRWPQHGSRLMLAQAMVRKSPTPFGMGRKTPYPIQRSQIVPCTVNRPS